MSTSKGEWARLQALFHEARELPRSERVQWLEDNCKDEDVRAEVVALLGADDEPDTRLVDPPTGLFDTQTLDEPPPADGRPIGPFKLVKLIASGGMGVVYEASQDEPRRSVALKLLRMSFDPVALQRFKYESQILAHLTHPGIAHVYESGTVTMDGRQMPWFAMELVHGGKPIDAYVRESKVKRDRALELFARVCDAIHHGHQKGVIHRDLKPGNILVGDDGEPKVIDFGIAKTTDPSMGLATIQTAVGQVVGTLRYMSPEQAAGPNNALDIRTDVYSLGVILYELITGTQPYPITRDELVQSLRTIVATPPDAAPLDRARTPTDLRTIVLKALEKEPDRRYSSAQALARDIERFLADEPIEARPPSALYQARKFAARNRGLVISIAGVVVALAVGSVGTTLGMLRAQEQSQAAERAREQAEDARGTAEQARDEAVWTENFLAELLQSADPVAGNASDVTVRDALERATEKLAEQPPPSDRAEARVRATLGEIHNNLGDFQQASAHLARALALRSGLEVDERETLRLERLLVAALVDGDRTAESLEHSTKTLERHRNLLGAEDKDTLSAMNLHADILAADGQAREAEQLYNETLERRTQVLGIDHPDTIESASNRAVALHNRGDYEASLPLLRDVLERRRRIHGNDHPSTLLAMGNLATALRTSKLYDEAEPLFREGVERKKSMLGENHPSTLLSLSDYGMLLDELGRHEESVETLEASVAGFEAGFGKRHRDTTLALGKLAVVVGGAGDAERAEGIHLDLLERTRDQEMGPYGGPVTAVFNYARFLAEQKRHEEAVTQFERAVKMGQEGLHTDHWLVGASQTNLGRVLNELGRHDEAEPHLLRAWEQLSKLQGEDSSTAQAAVDGLVTAYEALDRPEEAARFRALER